MPTCKQSFLGILIWTAWLFSSPTLAETPTRLTYDKVDVNPDFNSILKLDFREHDYRLNYGEGSSQYSLLWQAEKSLDKKTLVAMIHGGCWRNTFNIDHTFPLATALSKAGFGVYNIEYRRTGDPGGGWPGSYQDIQQALAVMIPLSKEKITFNKVVLMGHSAGGHLALLGALNLAEVVEPIDAEQMMTIGLAAITDIERYSRGKNSCQRAAVRFMSGHPYEIPKSYETANPVKNELSLPILLMQGTKDPIVPVSQAKYLKGPMLEVHMQPKAGHFDWIHPGTEAFQVLLEKLNQFANN